MDKNKIAVDLFNKHAIAYQNKFMDVSLYANSLDLFCDSIIKRNANILEIACGPGNITKYLLNKRPDFKILGTDLAPKMVDLAKTNNPKAEFNVMDCRNISSIKKLYDAVMCGFFLPYLSKEEALKLIYDCANLLSPGGVFYLSTMEDDYSKSGFRMGSSGEEMFMHYHEAAYLEEYLTEAAFCVEVLKRQEYPEKDGTVSTDLIILSRKL